MTPLPTSPFLSRAFAGGGGGTEVVFDKELKRRQRSAAAAREDAEEFEYLRTEVASVVDRIEDISNRGSRCCWTWAATLGTSTPRW